MTAAVAVPARRAPAERVVRAGERPLPVLAALEPLLPPGGLRRGSAVAVRGSASLLLALLAGPSQEGAWCAVVGLPALGLVAAAEIGIALERLALVPDPGPDWAAVAGALLDAVDVVVVAPRGRVLDGDVRRLAARARQRGTVLVPYGAVRWPGAERRLSVTSGTWEGLDEGSGHLRARRVVVRGEGRGSAVRARELRLWLPAPGGGVRADTEPATPLRVIPGTGSPSPAAAPPLRAVPDLPESLPPPARRLRAVPASGVRAGDRDPGDTEAPGSGAAGPGPGSAGPGPAPRPRPAGHPVPAGRSAAVGGGGFPVPPPPVGARLHREAPRPAAPRTAAPRTAGTEAPGTAAPRTEAPGTAAPRPAARPRIPPDVLARLRPASTLARPPHRAAHG